MIETHLDEIGRACGADKSSLKHHYLHYYHELLSPIRHQKVNMLEIGVLGGHSLCMWDAFFDHSGTTIWGVDIHDRWTPPPTSRITVRIGDASSEEFVSSLAIEAGMFDFIIDDGSHFSREQKLSLKYLWPHHLHVSQVFIAIQRQPLHPSWFGQSTRTHSHQPDALEVTS